MMFRRSLVAALGLLAAATLAAPAAEARSTVKLGVLTCAQVGTLNYVVYAKREFDCLFRSAGRGPDQRYIGTVKRIGATLKLERDARLAWVVFAPTYRQPRFALEGAYYGAGADAALYYGIGARALIGGFSNSINLQPVSFSGEKGYGVSAGLDGFFLKAINK